MGLAGCVVPTTPPKIGQILEDMNVDVAKLKAHVSKVKGTFKDAPSAPVMAFMPFEQALKWVATITAEVDAATTTAAAAAADTTNEECLVCFEDVARAEAVEVHGAKHPDVYVCMSCFGNLHTCPLCRGAL